MTDRRATRWTNLFDDLAAQLEHDLIADDVALQSEEERLRLGRLSVRDRLAAVAASGAPVTIALIDSRSVAVRVATMGRDWFAGDLANGASRRSQVVIPFSALAAIELDAAAVDGSLDGREESAEQLTARLGLSFVLRDLCRRRVAVLVVLRGGDAHGTIDRVGRDHFDLAMHDSDAPRRRDVVSGFRVVPFAELVMLRV
ncbi:MAG: hypothetical protein V4479_11470 [Actinomycetota bacterium]